MRRDALGGAGSSPSSSPASASSPASSARRRWRAVLDRGDGGAGGLEPQLDALGGGARGVGAVGQRLALGAAGRQRLLGLLARRAQPARARPRSRRTPRAPRGPRSASAASSARAARASSRASVQRASSVWRSSRSCSSAASAWRLSGRSRARASRSTSSARSRLSCVRVELELGAAAALAVLAEPGGLLDQQPPVARLGGDDRLDAALRDDGVHLLAEAGVRQDLEHVDEPAARAVDPVLALPRAVEPAA